MFTVDDLDDTVARLRRHGAELIGEVVLYENAYRLCELRGPSGILVALAEPIGWPRSAPAHPTAAADGG